LGLKSKIEQVCEKVPVPVARQAKEIECQKCQKFLETVPITKFVKVSSSIHLKSKLSSKILLPFRNAVLFMMKSAIQTTISIVNLKPGQVYYGQGFWGPNIP